MNRLLARVAAPLVAILLGAAAGLAWSRGTADAKAAYPEFAAPGAQVELRDFRPVVIQLGELQPDVAVPCDLTLVNRLPFPVRMSRLRSTCPCIRTSAAAAVVLASGESLDLPLSVVLGGEIQQSLAGVLIDFEILDPERVRSAQLLIAPRAWTSGHPLPPEPWERDGR